MGKQQGSHEARCGPQRVMHGGPQTESRSVMDPKHPDGDEKRGFNLKTHIYACSGQKVMQNTAAKKRNRVALAVCASVKSISQ